MFLSSKQTFFGGSGPDSGGAAPVLASKILHLRAGEPPKSRTSFGSRYCPPPVSDGSSAPKHHAKNVTNMLTVESLPLFTVASCSQKRPKRTPRIDWVCGWVCGHQQGPYGRGADRTTYFWGVLFAIGCAVTNKRSTAAERIRRLISGGCCSRLGLRSPTSAQLPRSG